MKKILFMVIIAMLLTIVSACNNTDIPNIPDDPDTPNIPETPIIALTPEEANLLQAIGADLNVIEESEYAETLTEMIYHVGSYSGTVVQFEGIYDSNLNGNSITYVYRILSNNGTETICGLPLSYMEKEIPDNSWVRVSGIINASEVNGTQATVLEVIAIETLAEKGAEKLDWTGSTHQH
ncbi:MAG: hypothetical protein IJP09_00610 [Clostridia bacterium]|nr:hypothetical protein [Clostridia bacterium]